MYHLEKESSQKNDYICTMFTFVWNSISFEQKIILILFTIESKVRKTSEIVQIFVKTGIVYSAGRIKYF